MRAFLLSAAILALWAFPGMAQHRAPEFAQWHAQSAALPGESHLRRVAVDTLRGTKSDYRYEGLVIGGLAFGALGVWMGSGTASSADCLLEPGVGCGDSDQIGPAVLGGLVGAAIGGGFGYVIGRLSGKRRPAAADSTAR